MWLERFMSFWPSRTHQFFVRAKFVYYGSKLWNFLPYLVKNTKAMNTFKNDSTIWCHSKHYVSLVCFVMCCINNHYYHKCINFTFLCIHRLICHQHYHDKQRRPRRRRHRRHFAFWILFNCYTKTSVINLNKNAFCWIIRHDQSALGINRQLAWSL